MARNRNDNRYPGRKKKSPMRVIFGWVMFIGVFLMLLFVLVPLVGATMKVTDGAMGPTLGIGDTVAVNHIAYVLFRPKRGDIVQFAVSEDSHAAAAQTGQCPKEQALYAGTGRYRTVRLRRFTAETSALLSNGPV